MKVFLTFIFKKIGQYLNGFLPQLPILILKLNWGSADLTSEQSSKLGNG